jgi:Flp pilus assembly protein TadG
MSHDLKSTLRRALADRRGSVAIIVGIAMIAVIGICAVVVDMAYVYSVHRQLQSATDQAALAGAQRVYDSAAVSAANEYSATVGNKNVNAGVTVTMASGYPQVKCLTSTGIPCGGSPSGNAVKVVQTATVPVFFARIFGKNTVTITTEATASAAGNQPKPYNIVMIIDTTGSMSSTDANCSISGASRLTCAKAGAKQLLSGMLPSMDKVALLTFPGLSNTSSNIAKQYNCNSDSPTVAAYNASPQYTVLSLSSDYRTSDTTTGLVNTSNLVRAFGGGGTGCTQGMSNPGGVGTFIADTIAAGQAILTANSATGVQNVMIVLSDGDSQASSSNLPTGKFANQCAQAVTQADAAAAAGTWVYSVAYGAPTTSGSSGSCPNDSPAVSACTTMQNIASDSSKFYASGGTCASTANPISDLVAIFGRIQSSLTSPRLLPDSTT